MQLSSSDKLLEVLDLNILIDTEEGLLPAVEGLSFYIKKGESLCLVGESGCGKSITALSILRLLSSPPLYISKKTKIIFKGLNLTNLSLEKFREIRGKEISMIFQEPMTALNPVFTIGEQISETILAHSVLEKREIKKYVLELMSKVGIPEPEIRYNAYPHELSGGLRQRALIAMALSCNPKLLIADEPTTALDVTIQAQILELLKKLQRERRLSLLFITHNLGVVAQIAQRVMVMYLGKIVEEATVDEIFKNPLHPYTKGLMASVPYGDVIKAGKLKPIKGSVPPVGTKISGCNFHPRCPFAKEICKSCPPKLKQISEFHRVYCHLV